MKPCIVWDSILSLEKASKGDISQIVYMVEALAEQKIDVSLVALNAGKAYIDGVNIRQVPNFWYIKQRTRTLGRLFSDLYGYGGKITARYIAKFVVNRLDPIEHYDLYHVRARNLAIELKRFQFNKPLVYTAIPQFLHTGQIKDKKLDQMAIDSADSLIALTEGWKQFILENFDVGKREIDVVPVCVKNSDILLEDDSKINKLFDGKKVIGYFGRLQEGYGIDVLIESIPEIRKHVDNLLVIIAGGSVYGYRDKLEALMRSLGVNDNVYFAGEIPRDLVPNYLSKCDVLISFRYSDNKDRYGFDQSIPIKCVEYIMQGKPVVATRDGGMEQLLGKDYPYLVEYNDKKKIVESIIKLLTDETEAQRISKQNKALSSRFTYESVSSHLIKVYNKAVNLTD
jgi:glycosyltransferase involved in cell wall biosynthesis